MIVKHTFPKDAIGRNDITCAEICNYKDTPLEVYIYYWRDEDILPDSSTVAILRIKTIKDGHKKPETRKSFPNMEGN